MKAIIVSEKRLNELIELTLARISKDLENPTNVDAKVTYRSVHYYIHILKNELTDSNLP